MEVDLEGDGEAAQDDSSAGVSRGLTAAVAEGMQTAPSHRILYRAILLDRTLRGLGIEEDDPAPSGVLLQFEAKTRRKMDLYYRPAHVCATCARWYERQSMRRTAELAEQTHCKGAQPRGGGVPPLGLSAAALGLASHVSSTTASAALGGVRISRPSASLAKLSNILAKPQPQLLLAEGAASSASLQRAMLKSSVSLPTPSKPNAATSSSSGGASRLPGHKFTEIKLPQVRNDMHAHVRGQTVAGAKLSSTEPAVALLLTRTEDHHPRPSSEAIVGIKLPPPPAPLATSPLAGRRDVAG